VASSTKFIGFEAIGVIADLLLKKDVDEFKDDLHGKICVVVFEEFFCLNFSASN